MPTSPQKGASYNQPTKNTVRQRSFAHAVELLTTQRQDAAIVPANYPSRIKAAFAESDDAIRVATAPSCEEGDIASWQGFRQGAGLVLTIGGTLGGTWLGLALNRRSALRTAVSPGSIDQTMVEADSRHGRS